MERWTHLRDIGRHCSNKKFKTVHWLLSLWNSHQWEMRRGAESLGFVHVHSQDHGVSSQCCWPTAPTTQSSAILPLGLTKRLPSFSQRRLLFQSEEEGQRLDYCFQVKWSEVKWSEVAQSCLTLCDSMDCSLPGFSVHGILQARILEWVTISFSRGSSWPRDGTRVSHIVGRRFNLWATREAPKFSNRFHIVLEIKSLKSPRAKIYATLFSASILTTSFKTNEWLTSSYLPKEVRKD